MDTNLSLYPIFNYKIAFNSLLREILKNKKEKKSPLVINLYQYVYNLDVIALLIY